MESSSGLEIPRDRERVAVFVGSKERGAFLAIDSMCTSEGGRAHGRADSGVLLPPRRASHS